jgi:putative ABC transport system permease protein
VQTLLADVRYASRVLFRAPSFTLAVVAILALAIGANTAIFSIVNAVLLRPLPFDDAPQVVRLFQVPPQDAFPGITRFAVSPGNFYDWKRDATLFESMAIYRFRAFRMTGGGTARSVIAAAVGADFFNVLRVQPALGRVFLAEEDAPGRSQVVILSDRFWRSHFNGAPDVVNQTLTLDGERYAVVGVMPAEFSMESWAATARDIWVPLAYTDEERVVRENHNAHVVARLKSTADVAQANTELTVISERLEREFPRDNAGWGGTVVPLHEVIVGDIRTSLLMLLGAVTLVLWLACANVGNLVLARAIARRKELAIRSALGAGRRRVLQQLVVEAMLLSIAGGAMGLLLADTAISAASALLATQLPRTEEIGMDVRVLLFVAGASIFTGILAGVIPALRAGRPDLTEALKEGGRDDSAVGIRTRRALIVCEVAVSVVLLMGAAVMFRSLTALAGVDPGFNPGNVLTMRVSLPETRYSTAPQMSGFFDTALERLRALPGVEAAGAIDDLPLQGGSVQPIVLEGRPELLPRDQPTVQVRKITPGYLGAMEIPLLQGRDVAESDTEVLLVSRAAASLLWGSDDPVGRRVTLPLQSRTVLKQVIGIVDDVKQGELSGAAEPTVYEYTRSRERAWDAMTFVMRTSVPPTSLAQAAAGIVRGIDPDQPVEDVRTMEEWLGETMRSQRFTALLLGLFASVALVLASVGIYSVLSYTVNGRRREIGIRTALGAQTVDVVRLVVREGMSPALVGIVIGAGAALASAAVLESLVFGVSASDPLLLGLVAATLTLMSLAASLLPAYRAARVDPLTALRAH